MANGRDFPRPPMLVIPEEEEIFAEIVDLGDDEGVFEASPREDGSDRGPVGYWASKLESMGPAGGYHQR